MTTLTRLKKVAAVWQSNLAETIADSGSNLNRKIRENKIKAAIVVGENPAADERFNQFVEQLDFVVVCDMFKTETFKMANVVLPMSGYLETEGHFTNWSGLRQPTPPTGDPINGMANTDIIGKLAGCFGAEFRYNSFQDLTSELDLMIKHAGLGGDWSSFPTSDGKAHFVAYSAEVSATSAFVPSVLEIDARIDEQIKPVRV